MDRSRILDKISGPADLKNLSREELHLLSQEIRQRIIEVTARRGGHLASSLGAVELAIALHRVFDSPRDKIIWDVSHQAYAHKIITGRNKSFDSLRTRDGICGFTRRSESEHDVVDAGHASTSISYALAFALAREYLSQDFQVVAVVGDGALTGGLAYEALNQMGQMGAHVILVLNDNGMSISKNVGALSVHLSQLRLNPAYVHLKKDIKSIIEGFPMVGDRTSQLIHNLKERVKNFLIPEFIFEELGIKYVGPIDGHNIDALENDLQLAKGYDGPVLLHVVTTKGKGYQHAEVRPETFHGTPPFAITTGKTNQKKTPTFTEVFGRTISNIAKRDRRVVAITAAMSLGTGLNDFSKEFPHRFFDVGIAEQHAVTLAAGLALNGLRPVVCIYSTFLQRAYDQIVQEVCLQNLPIIFAIDRAGLVGEDGPTHHGSFDLSYLRPIPNMTIMAPRNQEELRDMLWYALELNSPVAIRYPRGAGSSQWVDDLPRKIPPGKSQIIEEGSKLCLIGVGPMVEYAIQAGKIIKERAGIVPTVVNARFVKPLDRETLMILSRNHDIWVTIEDNALMGGFGEEVGNFLLEQGLCCKLIKYGLPDSFIEQGKIKELHSELGINSENISASVLRLLSTSHIA